MNKKNPHALSPIEENVEKVLSPFEAFVHDTKVSGAILFGCVVIAMLIANSPWADSYHRLLETQALIEIGEYQIKGSLHHWVNDGLMVLFFFVLGLEIKRELLVGKLKEIKRAWPVATAALGGMLVPAVIYYGFNVGTDTVAGWGIPMATDAALAVGVLSLLRGGVTSSLGVFLIALAIVDDIGAVVVIALFYAQDISLPHLAFGGGVFAGLIGLNILGIRRPSIYLIGGLILWIAMLGSGVHATSAGVLAAMATPARPERSRSWLVGRITEFIKDFKSHERQRSSDESILAYENQHAIIENIEQAAEKASTPLQRWERALERPIALFVLPLFALMNAGVELSTEELGTLWTEPVSLGIIFGLLIGKVVASLAVPG